MNEAVINNNNYIGYEYMEKTISRGMESMYVDNYRNFGWVTDGKSIPHVGLNSVTIKFKRNRQILNKTELTRMQRQFDACVNEIAGMEKSKLSKASAYAYTVGLIGTAFMAGATFSFLGGLIPLYVILAVPAFAGWILPHFLYKSIHAKQTAKVDPLIEGKYDEIYKVCERANRLLGN
ncbi:MAG: hypothetical protein FWD71_23585 [Oscillospiraceae bacterium]|nr:hypothetical protein [Oscillospiraceae bacterium]